MYFTYSDGYVHIGNWETNRTFYNSNIEDKKFENFEELSNWFEQWISDTTISDINELNEFLSTPKRHCKYKVGDFFRFKLNRRFNKP